MQALRDKRKAKHPPKTSSAPGVASSNIGSDGHGNVSAPGVVGTVPVADFRIGTPDPVTLRSSLLWLAQKASVRYFGWPEMSIEDFLESYLYYTLNAFGVHLFAMISDEELKKGGDHGGNGQSSIGVESTESKK